MLTNDQKSVLSAIGDVHKWYLPRSRGDQAYVDRSRRGQTLFPYEEPALELLSTLDVRRAVEIGAGSGQLGFLLAAEGWQVLALEGEDDKFTLMSITWSLLRGDFPGLAGRVKQLKDTFQNSAPTADVAIALGCQLFGPGRPIDPAVERPFRSRLRRYRHLLVDLRFYPQRDDDPAEWSRRLSLFPDYRVLKRSGYLGLGDSLFLLERKDIVQRALDWILRPRSAGGQGPPDPPAQPGAGYVKPKSDDERAAEIAALVRGFGETNVEGTALQADVAHKFRIGALNTALVEAGYKLIPVRTPAQQEELDYKLYLYPETERPAFPRYVNIGAGNPRHPYWHNIDNPSEHYAALQKADFIALDLMKEPMFPIASDSLGAAYTSHVFEHLPDEVDQHICNEVFRSLEPGGYFRITCPDHGMLYDALMRGDDVYFHEMQPQHRLDAAVHMVSFLATDVSKTITREEVWEILHSLPKFEALDEIARRSDPALNAKRPGWHRNWLSPEKVFEMLRKAGFSEVYESRPQQSHCPQMRHPKLFDIVGQNVSLYVEARKS